MFTKNKKHTEKNEYYTNIQRNTTGQFGSVHLLGHVIVILLTWLSSTMSEVPGL